jgi:hypothetical protein
MRKKNLSVYLSAFLPSTKCSRSETGFMKVVGDLQTRKCIQGTVSTLEDLLNPVEGLRN